MEFCFVSLLCHCRPNEQDQYKAAYYLKENGDVPWAIVMILNIGLVVFSQLTAFTPHIVDENGNIPENSIAELREVELNGRKEWISLRGWDKNAPVLLFLAGGPGGRQMAAVRHELAELENIL